MSIELSEYFCEICVYTKYSAIDDEQFRILSACVLCLSKYRLFFYLQQVAKHNLFILPGYNFCAFLGNKNLNLPLS